MKEDRYKGYCDGASRGNPGDASYGYVIYDKDSEMLSEGKGRLGIFTNNYAEYRSLIELLKDGINHKIRKINVYMDSRLVVMQIKGAYQVKNEKLRILYEEAKDIIKKYEKVEMIHIPRKMNSVADRLANEALDA